MKNIILLAIQGAGKGTLAKELSRKYGYVHISTGDLLRERSKISDTLGLQIKNLIDNGNFVSDEIILESIKSKITSEECSKGYILDGYPRNLEQAKAYDELLKELKMDLGVVINLTIPEEALYNRITGRRMCKNCGAIYNIYNENMKPTKENICDKCNGELYQRDDDNEESMKVRIDTYYKVTAPLIDYYKEKNNLYEVDSLDFEKTVESVEKIIL